MSDTRLKNGIREYKLQNRQFQEHILRYQTNSNKVYSKHNDFPCFGIQPGYRPNETLSYNPTETENYIYGIRSTDLTANVSPYENFKPKEKPQRSISFFERTPVIMPQPLVVLKNQRPYRP